MDDEIIMYTLPLCPHCARARRFFENRNISVTERNAMYPKNRKEKEQYSNFLSVPVVLVGDRVLVGFSKEEYEEAFKDY